MELPHWIREPTASLRVLAPGILFFAFAAAFFPRTLDGATRAVGIASNRSDLTLVMWASWVITIGIVFRIFWRFLYFLVGPRPHPSAVVGRVLDRAGAPTTTAGERRALYVMLVATWSEAPGAAALARERASVEVSYQAALVIMICGAFMAYWHSPSALVSAHFGLVEGLVFIAAGAGLFVWVRLRDGVIHRVELALVRWGDPETAAFLQRAHANMWAAAEAVGSAPASPEPPKS